MLQHGLVMSGVAQKLHCGLHFGLDVRCGGTAQKAQSLSGGNLQKFIVGREIGSCRRSWPVAQPTGGRGRGRLRVDRQQIIDLGRGGVAVLVISEDLGEILEMCDRGHGNRRRGFVAVAECFRSGAEEIGR